MKSGLDNKLLGRAVLAEEVASQALVAAQESHLQVQQQTTSKVEALKNEIAQARAILDKVAAQASNGHTLEALAELAVAKVQQLTENNATKVSQYQELYASSKLLESLLATATAERGDLEVNLKDARDQVQALQKQLKEAQSDSDSTQELHASSKLLESLLATATAERGDLEVNLKDARDQVQALQKQLKEAQSDSDSTQQNTQQLNARIAELSLQMDQECQQEQTLRKELATSSNQAAQYLASLEQAQSRLCSLEKQVADEKYALQSVSEQQQQATEQLHSMAGKLMNERNRADALQETCAQKDKVLVQMHEEQESLLKQISRLQAEGRDVIARADAMHQNEEESQWELDQLRKEKGAMSSTIAAAREERLQMQEDFAEEAEELRAEIQGYKSMVDKLQIDM